MLPPSWPKYQPISEPETPHVITSFQSSRFIIHGQTTFFSERELKKALRDTLTWTAWYGISPLIDNGRNFLWLVLSMCMQVIPDSLFARVGSAPIWSGKKGEFRYWTRLAHIRRSSCWQELRSSRFSKSTEQPKAKKISLESSFKAPGS